MHVCALYLSIIVLKELRKGLMTPYRQACVCVRVYVDWRKSNSSDRQWTKTCVQCGSGALGLASPVCGKAWECVLCACPIPYKCRTERVAGGASDPLLVVCVLQCIWNTCVWSVIVAGRWCMNTDCDEELDCVQTCLYECGANVE